MDMSSLQNSNKNLSLDSSSRYTSLSSNNKLTPLFSGNSQSSILQKSILPILQTNYRNIYIQIHIAVSEKDKNALIKMRQSKLFGEKELILLEKRIKGDKKDPTGLWSRKVKPKVAEILSQWLPRKNQLKKIIKPEDSSKRKNLRL